MLGRLHGHFVAFEVTLKILLRVCACVCVNACMHLCSDMHVSVRGQPADVDFLIRVRASRDAAVAASSESSCRPMPINFNAYTRLRVIIDEPTPSRKRFLRVLSCEPEARDLILVL